ncbi:MAG: hypothetical protein HZB26_17695 [Candidatus Hydrogenedentes bacterium]|nr:hypothetical protein [Candidatus Hydrogenedentota bacterium]
MFDRNYTKWNDEKKIPDAQAAVFSDLHEVSQREDASFWVVMLCFGTANTVLEDGKVTDDEAKSMKDVADFVKEKPGAGLVEFGNFFQSHPDIEKAFKSMQQRHAPAPTQ